MGKGDGRTRSGVGRAILLGGLSRVYVCALRVYENTCARLTSGGCDGDFAATVTSATVPVRGIASRGVHGRGTLDVRARSAGWSVALAVPARHSMNLRERPSVSSLFCLRFHSVISAACAEVTGTELA